MKTPRAQAPESRFLPRITLSTRRNSRHPWIYRKMCRPTEIPPGSLVEVIDREGRFVGRGIYNRNSQIAVRLLTEDPARPLDERFFEAALDDAVRLRRETLGLDRVTTAYRVVHAEGDGLSGLVADRLGSFVVVELFSAGWFRMLRWLLPALSQRFDGATVLVRADAIVEKREGFHVRDFVAERLGPDGLLTTVEEGGIRYRVDLRRGHKTGFFCDQREHRLRVRGLAKGAKVLDAFSYTGGFALNAARGGAASVTAVELDENALAIARENARLNGLRVETLHADAFHFLREAAAEGRRFDLVVLDPPKFAAGRSEVEGALRRYRDLSRLGCGVLEEGARLIACSCSGSVSEERFRSAVERGARGADVRLELEGSGGAGPDHPLRPEFPEGRYLKVLTYRARRG